jgi:hypothetical protein
MEKCIWLSYSHLEHALQDLKVISCSTLSQQTDHMFYLTFARGEWQKHCQVIRAKVQ